MCDSSTLRQGRGGRHFARAFARFRIEDAYDGIVPSSPSPSTCVLPSCQLPEADVKDLASSEGTGGKFIFQLFHATLRALLGKLFRNNVRDFGVVLLTLIPNAPYPSGERFAFFAHGFLHYFSERFSFLTPSRKHFCKMEPALARMAAMAQARYRPNSLLQGRIQGIPLRVWSKPSGDKFPPETTLAGKSSFCDKSEQGMKIPVRSSDRLSHSSARQRTFVCGGKLIHGGRRTQGAASSLLLEFLPDCPARALVLPEIPAQLRSSRF